MGLRPRRQNVVVWHQSAVSPGRYAGLRPTGGRRIRPRLRTAALIAVLGLVRAVRPRWRPLLTGVACTAAGAVMHRGVGGMLIIPGTLFLLVALLTPGEIGPAHDELERELAAYSTTAQRWDLEATLDRYPDSVTCELRDILARQGPG